jgi:hypothetical protein
LTARARQPHPNLTLLREGALFGCTRAWTDAGRNSALKSVQDAIRQYADWAPRSFGLGMASALGQAETGSRYSQPSRPANGYRQQVIPAVLDLAACSPGFDPATCPQPAWRDNPPDVSRSRCTLGPLLSGGRDCPPLATLRGLAGGSVKVTVLSRFRW